MNKRKVEIYTDGGCNQLTDKKGTWAFIAVENDDIIFETYGSIENTTNSVVELTAMREAYLFALSLGDDVEVLIRSDSAYVVNGVNAWGDSWLNNNYKNGSVKHIEIWDSFLPQRKNNIVVEWVKGHSNNVWNEYVDKLTHHGRKEVSSSNEQSQVNKILKELKNNIHLFKNKDLDKLNRIIKDYVKENKN